MLIIYLPTYLFILFKENTRVKIFYATRTHKQIEQVIRQLNETEYRTVRCENIFFLFLTDFSSVLSYLFYNSEQPLWKPEVVRV